MENLNIETIINTWDYYEACDNIDRSDSPQDLISPLLEHNYMTQDTLEALAPDILEDIYLITTQL